MKLKALSEQILVITGATSGIGLATARMAAEKGAKLVLIARNEDALRELSEEINSSGGRAIYSAADVADENALRQAAQKAMAEFGRIDTWVNNAGGSVYGRITEVPIDDLRRLFETNVWGVVNGSRIAVEHLRENGGALINVGSEVSDAAIPLQGMYSSSKHAVKGFTNALRMELEGDKLPISVTLIKPTAIHTPFTENAKNYLPYEPQLPSPLFAPELVAEAILYSAENQMRDFFVGETAKAHSSIAQNMPRAYDKMNEMMIDSMQNSGKPAKNRPDGLYKTNSKLHERGAEDRFVMEDSLYQKAKIHPLLFTTLTIGGAIGLIAFINSRKKSTDGTANATKKFTLPTNPHGIREHMEVIGSDDQHVGIVDKVEELMIKLTKSDSASGGRHHIVPLEWVETVAQNKVRLNKTSTEARSHWVSGASGTDLNTKSSTANG